MILAYFSLIFNRILGEIKERISKNKKKTEKLLIFKSGCVRM